MDEKDDTRSYPWDFSSRNCMSNGGKNTSVHVGQKSWLILCGAGFVLWQRVYGCTLFVGTEPLARVRHCGPALMEKGHFLRLIFKGCLQGYWNSYLGDLDASVFKLCHWSQVRKCVLQCVTAGVTRRWPTVTNYCVTPHLSHYVGGMWTYLKHSFSFQACINMKPKPNIVLHGSSL